MKYTSVVFAGGSGTIREPMAAGIMRSIMPGMRSVARGMVVLFPEPMNQKVEAVLAANDISLPGFVSSPLTEEDFSAGTLVIAMSRDDLARIREQFEGSTEQNTALLTDFTGEELEILDPYGQSLQGYGLCYETLKSTLSRLREIIQEGYNE